MPAKFSIKQYIKEHPYKTAMFIGLGILSLAAIGFGIAASGGFLLIPLGIAGAAGGAAVAAGGGFGVLLGGSLGIGAAITTGGVVSTAITTGAVVNDYQKSEKEQSGFNFRVIQVEQYGNDVTEAYKKLVDLTNEGKNLRKQIKKGDKTVSDAKEKLEEMKKALEDAKTKCAMIQANPSSPTKLSNERDAKSDKSYYEKKIKMFEKLINNVEKGLHKYEKKHQSSSAFLGKILGKKQFLTNPSLTEKPHIELSNIGKKKDSMHMFTSTQKNKPTQQENSSNEPKRSSIHRQEN